MISSETLSEDTLKVIAVLLVSGTDFFVENDTVYAGTREESRIAYLEWCEKMDEVDRKDSWEEYLDAEGEIISMDDDYLVLTDREADEAVGEYIHENVWAFNPSFLEGCTGIESEVWRRLSDGCESANGVILRLIGDDIDRVIDDAVRIDGRGHFLASYDGEEHEVNLCEYVGKNYYLYVYRVN